MPAAGPRAAPGARATGRASAAPAGPRGLSAMESAIPPPAGASCAAARVQICPVSVIDTLASVVDTLASKTGALWSGTNTLASNPGALSSEPRALASNPGALSPGPGALRPRARPMAPARAFRRSPRRGVESDAAADRPTRPHQPAPGSAVLSSPHGPSCAGVLLRSGQRKQSAPLQRTHIRVLDGHRHRQTIQGRPQRFAAWAH